MKKKSGALLMEPITRLAEKYNLVVIEDAAHSFPAQYKGQNIGTLSQLTVFSFYATKTITTGEGGMITTDNDEMAARMRIMRLHGISKDAWHLYTLRLRPEKLSITRADLIERLKDMGIGTSVHFIPLHLHPAVVLIAWSSFCNL